MIALNILDIKKFMSAFLIGSLFDDYLLIESQITTFCTFSIDGRLEKLFGAEGGSDAEETAKNRDTSEDQGADYVRWSAVREKCFSVIKGKHTPLFFKFVFFFPPEKLREFLNRTDSPLLPQQLGGLCLNLRFDGTNLFLTTGLSLKVFSPDRELGRAWDDFVRQLLIDHDILVSEM